MNGTLTICGGRMVFEIEQKLAAGSLIMEKESLAREECLGFASSRISGFGVSFWPIAHREKDAHFVSDGLYCLTGQLVWMA